MRRLALTASLLLAGCFDEPTYEGLSCDDNEPCPSGFRCVNNACTDRPPAPLDAGASTDGGSDEDASGRDSGGEVADGGTIDVGPGDAGDPNLARCSDPVSYPSAGWEVRHFTLAAGPTFDQCFGVEDLASDDIDRDYAGNGPLNGTITDFGSRYTATRTFLEGVYTFTFTHDDGIRVRIDGQLVYEQWVHGLVTDAHAYSAYLTAGEHQLEVEHYDDGGWAQIVVSWQRGCAGVTAPSGGWALSYHPYDPGTNTLIYDQCYGVEAVSSTFLNITGTPALVAAQGVTTNYGIVGHGLHDYRGLTRLDFAYRDGLRAGVDGLPGFDDWTAQAPTARSLEQYLPVPGGVDFEKFVTSGSDLLSISWTSLCDEMPTGLSTAEWWVRYYRILYTSSPESWTIDRDDCLGVQTIATDQLTQSGEPNPILSIGATSLWGGEFFGTRIFGTATTISLTYDDGIRVYDGGALLYESWLGPQVGQGTIQAGAGSHAFRIEYFQNYGGTQIRFNW